MIGALTLVGVRPLVHYSSALTVNVTITVVPHKLSDAGSRRFELSVF